MIEPLRRLGWMQLTTPRASLSLALAPTAKAQWAREAPHPNGCCCRDSAFIGRVV